MCSVVSKFSPMMYYTLRCDLYEGQNMAHSGQKGHFLHVLGQNIVPKYEKLNMVHMVGQHF